MALTQKQENMIRKYRIADYSELWQVYGSYSNAKARSFEAIKAEQAKRGGYDMRITSHNTSFYSCAYRYERDGKEWLRYHTHTNAYDIPLDD